MIEIWKDVPGYEGKYMVSDQGRVKSMGGRIGCSLKPKIMSLSDDGKGYLKAALTRDNKTKRPKVHQLIAMAFLGHVCDGHTIVVDHINDIKHDNRAENLQLLTARENGAKTSKNKVTTSDYMGVCLDKTRSKWRAAIYIKGKRYHLGRFATEIEASNAYQQALSEL